MVWTEWTPFLKLRQSLSFQVPQFENYQIVSRKY